MKPPKIGEVAVLPKIWEIGSLENVKRLRLLVSSVPVKRTEKETKDYEEWYSIGMYLLRLGTEGLLTYPFKIEKGQSPDFMQTWRSGETIGLEVTRATDKQLQQNMTKAEREFGDREAKAAASGGEPVPVCTSLSEAGWKEGEREGVWVCLMRKAVEKKLSQLPRYRSASRHDLLIYDDTPVLGVGREKVFAALNPEVKRLKEERKPAFGVISVIMSEDVAFDVGGEFRFFSDRN